MDCMRLYWIAAVLGLSLTWASAAQAGTAEPCQDYWATETAPAPEEGQRWTFTFAPYVYHWKHDPEHRDAFVFALEQNVAGQRFCGLSLFRNSFGQPSAYAYLGQRWDNFLNRPQLSLKVSLGVIYGYVEDHRDKVPFNWHGFSPTVIPSLAYQLDPHNSLDVMVLGTAGLVFAYSHTF